MVTSTLVEDASGERHGLVPPPRLVPAGAADVPGVFHASVTRDLDPTRSAGGGVARDPGDAEAAAVGEALERWAASAAQLPLRRASDVSGPRVRLAEWSLHDDGQRRAPDFPHADAYPADEWLTEVYDLATNEPCWVPAALVSLTDDFGALATSSGLAADPSVRRALLRAAQELVERDAYVVTWLHQLGGREVAVPPALEAEVARLGGRCRAFDLTPDFSPHPVAAVTGTLPLAGAPRHSLGLACRARWDEAVDKAYLEMLQGTVFVGHQMASHPELWAMPADAVSGFDEHAVYYAANPQLWDELPLHRHARPAGAPADAGDGSMPALVRALGAAGVRLYYRELTTLDCRQLGLRVVRVLSPDLAPLHHNHRWPHLGGRTADATWRYADAAERAAGPFPSPYPHALG